LWAIDNNTPYAAERSWVRDKDGSEVWLVAVKGTFLISPDGSTMLAEKQEEALLVPKYTGEPGQSSLLYESDLVRTKPGTDILLNGHAYAPQGKPCASVDVEMKVDDFQKRLRVFGDRVWEKGLLGGVDWTSPKPFDRMPIIYERAFGGADLTLPDPKEQGWEPRNPIGTGFALKAKHLAGKSLPNIEDPKKLIGSWKDRPHPAGFGPIPGGWHPRLALAGTYDEAWQANRHPLLPLDFDDRFFHCAPEDQRTPKPLKGGETVELSNLTPGGLLKFTLPRVALGFTTHFFQGDPADHRATLHTIILEPDVPRVILVWHTALACHSRVNALKETEIWEKKILAGFSEQVDTTPVPADPFAGKVWQ